MRILVTTGPAQPLWFPLVPTAWALRAAGHDVLVAAPESFAPVVHGAGLAMAPVCGPLQMAEVMGHDRTGTPIRMPRNHEEAHAAIAAGFGRLAARTLDGTRELVGRWRPDVVLAESYGFAAAAAAAAVHDVAWVRHAVGPGDLDIAEGVQTELAGELAALGLDRLPDPELVLDNRPPVLGGAAPGARPIRYVPYSEPGQVPAWVLADRHRPRVLVTLGTVQPQTGDLDSLREMVTALAEDVEVVVALADALVEHLGPLPSAVVAAGWLSLTTVLAGCDAAVHHGGPGTMMACLDRGLPQVVVPGRGKPLAEIARLARFGAVRVLPPTELDGPAIRAAVRTVLDDPSYRVQAGRVRDELAAIASPADIVADVVALGRARATAA